MKSNASTTFLPPIFLFLFVILYVLPHFFFVNLHPIFSLHLNFFFFSYCMFFHIFYFCQSSSNCSSRVNIFLGFNHLFQNYSTHTHKSEILLYICNHLL